MSDSYLSCDCIAYERDDDGEDACMCGHSIEEHEPTAEYPGDTSCKAEVTE